MGAFIAVSPFFGFHWLLTIVCAAVFRLNIGVMYGVAHIINNPVTLVPIYLLDYKVGVWITQHIFGSPLSDYNPVWMSWLNTKLAMLNVPHLSLIAFLIGGHIVGIMLALGLFPLFYALYGYLLSLKRAKRQDL